MNGSAAQRRTGLNQFRVKGAMLDRVSNEAMPAGFLPANTRPGPCDGQPTSLFVTICRLPLIFHICVWLSRA